MDFKRLESHIVMAIKMAKIFCAKNNYNRCMFNNLNFPHRYSNTFSDFAFELDLESYDIYTFVLSSRYKTNLSETIYFYRISKFYGWRKLIKITRKKDPERYLFSIFPESNNERVKEVKILNSLKEEKSWNFFEDLFSSLKESGILDYYGLEYVKTKNSYLLQLKPSTKIIFSPKFYKLQDILNRY